VVLLELGVAGMVLATATLSLNRVAAARSCAAAVGTGGKRVAREGRRKGEVRGYPP
jgi:hypothetical protein